MQTIYSDVTGNRPHILFLHGALGTQAQFRPWGELLEKDFTVHLLDFEGHGSRPMADRPFRISHFAENVAGYLAENGLKGMDMFGYSMGGAVALYLAKTEPELVGRIFTFATKFDWNPESASHEVKFLNPDQILEKVPNFAKTLETAHMASDWREVLARTRDMMLHLGRENPLKDGDFQSITNTVRIGLGDRDNMVTLEESIGAYRKLPEAQLFIMPDTPHPVDKIDIKRIVQSIREFFLD